MPLISLEMIRRIITPFENIMNDKEETVVFLLNRNTRTNGDIISYLSLTRFIELVSNNTHLQYHGYNL